MRALGVGWGGDMWKNEKGKETHSTFFLLNSNEEKSVSGKYQGNLMVQANGLPSDFTFYKMCTSLLISTCAVAVTSTLYWGRWFSGYWTMDPLNLLLRRVTPYDIIQRMSFSEVFSPGLNLWGLSLVEDFSQPAFSPRPSKRSHPADSLIAAQ